MRLSDLQIVDQSDPNFVYGRSASRNAQPFSGLVVHHTADKPIQNLVNYGKTVDRQRGGAFGYHFYVGKDGQIIQGAPLDKRTNHIKPPKHGQRKGVSGLSNANAIGITLVGAEHGATPQQQAAAAKLGRTIMAEYGIGSDMVFGHGDLQHDRQHTEGAELVAMLRGGGGSDLLMGGPGGDVFQKVQDPEVLKQLGGDGLKKVTDPAVLDQLNGGRPAPQNPAQTTQPAKQATPQMPEGMVELPNGHVLDTNALVEHQLNSGDWAPYITGLAGNYLQGIPFLGEYIDEAIGAISEGLDGVPGLKQELARAYQRKFAELYPNAATGAQVAGGVITTAPLAIAAAPGVAAAAPGSLVGQVGTGLAAGAAGGAVEGAVSGFGAGTGGVENRLDEAGTRAQLGGAIGGAVGAAAPLVAKGVGAVAERFTGRNTRPIARAEGVSDEAVELTGRALQNDGGTASLRNLDAPNAMLADAGPSSAGLLDATIQKAGPGGAQARKAISDRTSAAAKDLTTALDDTFGAPQIAKVARDPKKAAQLNRLYNVAYSKPIDYSGAAGQEIETLLDRVPKAAFQEAERLMQVEGVQSAQRLVRVLDNGQIQVARYPDVRQLDYITRALNDIAKSGDGKGVMGGNTNIARVHANLSREIRSALKDAVPEWGTAVNRAATEISLKEARELGEVALASRTTRGELFEAIQDMGEAELQKLKEGIRANIDDTLANVKRTLTDPNVEAREAVKALKDLSSRSAHQKLEMILGKKEATAFIRRMNRATKAFDLKANLHDNSKTYARQSVDEAMKARLEPGALGTLLEGNPVGAAKRLVQRLSKMTPEARQEIEENLAGEIAKILTETRGRNAGRVLVNLTAALEKDAAGMALAQRLRAISGASTVVAGDQAQVPLQMNRPQ